MKFKFRKLSVKVVEQRVREEEARTGKQVEEVVLDLDEWFEFIASTGLPASVFHLHDYYNISLFPALDVTGPGDYFPEVRTIKVRRA